MAARKWIARRMEELDPETDYDEIWKLMAAYQPNEFVMNLVYTVTFPHFIVRELDALPVVRAGDGKMFQRAHSRADDTTRKFQTWWANGSTSEETKKSVDGVNAMHARYAVEYPDSFAVNDTFVYALCYEAAGLHRLMLRVGRPGFSKKEQEAAARYWGNVAVLFKLGGTGPSVTGFPESFEGVMAFMDAWEAEDVPRHAYGHAAVTALLNQFAERFFPRPLRGLARKWVISLYPDHLVHAYELKVPNRLAKVAYRKFTATVFWIVQHVAPDPQITYIERHRQRDDAAVDKIKRMDAEFKARHQPDFGCPHAAMSSVGEHDVPARQSV
ncbi:MAG TPA: hypothetical protein VNQ73_15280 [Ilumatobacter sp.]|nr:hypothetical protein [Ilumatobacter sp.]